jgi:hypothetical protein
MPGYEKRGVTVNEANHIPRMRPDPDGAPPLSRQALSGQGEGKVAALTLGGEAGIDHVEGSELGPVPCQEERLIIKGFLSALRPATPGKRFVGTVVVQFGPEKLLGGGQAILGHAAE